VRVARRCTRWNGKGVVVWILPRFDNDNDDGGDEGMVAFFALMAHLECVEAGLSPFLSATYFVFPFGTPLLQ